MQDITFDFSTLDTLEEIPETSADIEVPDDVLSGPETAEDTGIANLLLDAISNSTDTIQMYNAIIANTTDENLIDELNEILVDENRNMGKLQALLQNVSPNAEEIMNGAIEIQGVEDSPVDESLDEDVNNRKVYVVEPHKIDMDLYDIVFIHNGERASSKRFESYEDAVKFIKKNAKYNNWIAGNKADFQSKEDKLTGFGKNINVSKINESLNEAAGNKVTLFCTFEPYERYVSRSGLKKLKASGKDYLEAISKLTDKMGLYIDSDRIEEDGMTFDEVIDSIEMSNGDGCDYIVELKDNQGNVYIQAEYENEYEDVDESLILDESNNLDTALDDVTPVRDVHNERAIRDHKKAKEDRKKAYKEISKTVEDAIELDESLFEDAHKDY